MITQECQYCGGAITDGRADDTCDECSTRSDSWFASASVGAQIHYAIGCAIADRHSSAQFWGGREYPDSEPRNLKLAADAEATIRGLEALRQDIIEGRVTIGRKAVMGDGDIDS